MVIGGYKKTLRKQYKTELFWFLSEAIREDIKMYLSGGNRWQDKTISLIMQYFCKNYL